jgi:hypothetical protein
MKKRLGSAFAVFATCLLLASAAEARSIYCCKDERGLDACSDILPPACYGRAYREISERGNVIRRVDAPLTSEQRAAKEEERKKAKEAEKRQMEQERKNRALLATYSSEQDIDVMRDRNVAEMENAIRLSREKYDEAARKKKKIEDEAEFYRKKGLPPELRAALRESDNEMRAQQSAIEARQKEIEAVKARYEEEKIRYRELTSVKKPAPAVPAAPAEARPR